MSVRVILADDHRIMREGLRALLEKEPDYPFLAVPGREFISNFRYFWGAHFYFYKPVSAWRFCYNY